MNSDCPCAKLSTAVPLAAPATRPHQKVPSGRSQAR